MTDLLEKYTPRSPNQLVGRCSRHFKTLQSWNCKGYCILSGPSASGKTLLCDLLREERKPSFELSGFSSSIDKKLEDAQKRSVNRSFADYVNKRVRPNRAPALCVIEDTEQCSPNTLRQIAQRASEASFGVICITQNALDERFSRGASLRIHANRPQLTECASFLAKVALHEKLAVDAKSIAALVNCDIRQGLIYMQNGSSICDRQDNTSQFALLSLYMQQKATPIDLSFAPIVAHNYEKASGMNAGKMAKVSNLVSLGDCFRHGDHDVRVYMAVEHPAVLCEKSMAIKPEYPPLLNRQQYPDCLENYIEKNIFKV